MTTLQALGVLAVAVGVLGVATWLWDEFRWASSKVDDRCLCGEHSLRDIHAQHTRSMIHERSRCFPAIERVQA